MTRSAPWRASSIDRASMVMALAGFDLGSRNCCMDGADISEGLEVAAAVWLGDRFKMFTEYASEQLNNSSEQPTADKKPENVTFDF